MTNPPPPSGRPAEGPYGQPPQGPYGQPARAPYPQAPAQPGQAAAHPGPAPYAHSGQAYPGQAYQGRPGADAAQANSADRRRNRVGLWAAILVAVILIVQTISSFLTGALLRASSGSFELYTAFTLATVIIQGLLAVVAIVLGAIGLAGRDRPKALAGMGLGGGIVVLWGILAGQLSNVLLYAFSG